MNEIYFINNMTERILSGKYTNFLDSRKQELIKSKLPKNSYKVFKPYKDSEKVIFYSNNRPKIFLYKIICDEKLFHKDILGSLFSLNIDESLFGDIIVFDDNYYIYLMPSIKEYVLSSLIKIKHSIIKLEETPIHTLSNYERKYETISFIVSSCRIDNVCSYLAHTNREKIKDKIKLGEILVNYTNVKNSYMLKENDVFSIRKIGKFKFYKIINETKKDKIVVEVLKYI